ncbi:MAG: hypothetical protein MHM6MM_000497 [Cercozoa sp. M6MM]
MAELLQPSATIQRVDHDTALGADYSFQLSPDTLEELSPHSWTNSSGSNFRVRVGPDYATHGRKEQSADSLLEVWGCDTFKSSEKIENIARFFDLPEATEEDRRVGMPRTIVVNVQIPDYYPPTPLFGGSKTDGESYSLVFFARLTDEVRQEMLNAEATDSRDCDHDAERAAVRLLRRFVFAHSEAPLRKRFKVIARALNIAQTDFSMLTRRLVSGNNAKPFLARTSSSFYKSKQPFKWFEIQIDVHKFGYPARRALAGVKESISTTVFDFGFVVQGEDDEELPEIMMEAIRFCYLDLDKVHEFPADGRDLKLQEPADEDDVDWDEA